MDGLQVANEIIGDLIDRVISERCEFCGFFYGYSPNFDFEDHKFECEIDNFTYYGAPAAELQPDEVIHKRILHKRVLIRRTGEKAFVPVPDLLVRPAGEKIVSGGDLIVNGRSYKRVWVKREIILEKHKPPDNATNEMPVIESEDEVDMAKEFWKESADFQHPLVKYKQQWSDGKRVIATVTEPRIKQHDLESAMKPNTIADIYEKFEFLKMLVDTPDHEVDLDKYIESLGKDHIEEDPNPVDCPTCQVCDWQGQDVPDIKRHYKDHHVDECCFICHKFCGDVDEVADHLEHFHKDSGSTIKVRALRDLKDQTDDDNDEVFTYKCLMCSGHYVNTSTSVFQHLKLNCKGGHPVVPEEEDRLVNDIQNAVVEFQDDEGTTNTEVIEEEQKVDEIEDLLGIPVNSMFQSQKSPEKVEAKAPDTETIEEEQVEEMDDPLEIPVNSMFQGQTSPEEVQEKAPNIQVSEEEKAEEMDDPLEISADSMFQDSKSPLEEKIKEEVTEDIKVIIIREESKYFNVSLF